ncbi:MAG: ATP-binding protein, partial [Dolichospermum sp.]
ISCIASYAEDAQIPISRQSFIQEYQVPEHWFGRKKVYDMLTRTPLYLQLSNRSISSGKRKSGTVEEALRNAEQAFRKININITTKDTTKQKKISDQRFNKAFYLALVDAFTLDGQSNVKFYCEKEHPLLNIRPDILVDIPDEKYICIELSYTVDKKPSYIADYVLKKLDKYMIQLQEQLGLTQDFWKY